MVYGYFYVSSKIILLFLSNTRQSNARSTYNFIDWVENISFPVKNAPTVVN